MTVDNSKQKIMVNSLGKSGTTWVRGILSSIKGYESFPLGDHALMGLKPTDLELVNPGQIYHGHQVYSDALISIAESNDINIVYVFRDVRDAIVSNYYHFRFIDPKGIGNSYPPLHSLDINQACGPDHLLKWCPVAKNYGDVAHWLKLDNIITVSYEELKRDLFKEVARILKDLKIILSKKEVERICIANTFEMKSGRKIGQEVATSMQRKGLIGDWKNHFNSKVINYHKQLFGNLLIQYGYEKDLNWDTTTIKIKQSNVIGWVDSVSAKRIAGWALRTDSFSSVKVILYVNGNEIVTNNSDRFREDLKEKQIHPDGTCGFVFILNEIIALKPEDKVMIRVENDFEFLPFSNEQELFLT